MAEIGTYVCSNKECRLTLRLGRDFPVWKESAPQQVKTPTPSQDAAQFIERYRTDALCTSCRKVVDATTMCPHCSSATLREEQLNQLCPQCSIGTFALSNLVVY